MYHVVSELGVALLVLLNILAGLGVPVATGRWNCSSLQAEDPVPIYPSRTSGRTADRQPQAGRPDRADGDVSSKPAIQKCGTV